MRLHSIADNRETEFFQKKLGFFARFLNMSLVQKLIMVDLRINETFPMHSQPPKSPLSGGLWKLRAGRSYW